jgi:NADH pyrophosphatase NudC (nudix superfamily)
MNYGFIYETTNLINGMKYIGQHKRSGSVEDPDDTWYLGSGKIISRAIMKHGKENFSRTILCECNNQEDLNNIEEYFIKLYNAHESKEYYNICLDSKPNPHPFKSGRDNPSNNPANKLAASERIHHTMLSEDNLRKIAKRGYERFTNDNPMRNEDTKANQLKSLQDKIKVCKMCGKEFHLSSAGQKYCTPECRDNFYK